VARRVSRGGRISRMILIIASGAAYAVTALAVARLCGAGHSWYDARPCGCCLGAARGSAADSGVPGEHGCHRDSGMQASRSPDAGRWRARRDLNDLRPDRDSNAGPTA
jgi:hypothetical protein